MLSRISFFRNLVLVFTVAISASSCSLRFNDKVEKAPMNVNLGGGCLNQSGKTLTKFSAGTASDADIDTFFNCTEKSLNTFNNYAQGDSGGVYKATDLSRFLTKYFLGGRVIPSALLSEAMVMKQSLIGGSSDQLTRKELLKILRLMKVARGVSKRLRPHMPISYATFVERKYSKEDFETAINEFQLGFAELADAVKETQGSYSFDHMAAFYTELGKFLYPDEAEMESKWVGTILKWTKALRPAKVILISPGREEISATDWATLYRMAPKYYSLYLRARFYSQGENNYTYGQGLLRLESLFDDSIQLFDQALAQRPSGEIKSEEIEDLLSAMNEADLLPMHIDTARAAVKLIFAKLFNVQTLSSGYIIGKENFRQLSQTFHFATEGLRALEALYREKLGDEQFDSGGLKAEDFVRYGTDKMLEATLLHDQISRAAVESLAKSASEISTVFPGSSTRIVVPSGNTKPKLSLQHMAKIHLMRSLNRLLIGAYAGPKANALSEVELKTLLKDIFPILRDPFLALADAETEKSVPSRLFEASLFLPSSDGDKGLTMNEAIEFESLLLSTITHAASVHSTMAEICKLSAGPVKQQKIAPDCYRKNFLKSASSIWSFMPGLGSYFAKLPEREQEMIFSRLENFLRKGRTNDDFTLSDTRSFIQMPYYVEMIFARFDKNHDGLLENEEAELAYPVFQPFLAEKARQKGKTDPADHHAIYMYLLANRTLPSADNWSDALAYAWHRYIAGDKAFKADRAQVIEIFEKLLTL